MSQKPRPRRRLSNTPKFVEETSYFRMLRETKEKAAKQKADQLKEAEKLVSKESPTSRRRGKMLQRTAENIEKEALEEFQSTFNAHLTQQAELRPENHLEFISKTFMEKSGKHLHRDIVSHAPITEKIRKANETDWREILQISLKLWDDISKN